MQKIRIFSVRHALAVDITEAFCATSALFYLYFAGKTNYLPTVLIIICLTLLFRWLRRNAGDGAGRVRHIALAVSAMLAVALVVTNGTKFAWGFVDTPEAYRFFMSIIGLFLLYFRLLCYLYAQVLRQTDSGTAASQPRQQSNKRMFLITAVVCFCCYLPYFLAAYPAILTFDSVWQINQAFGIDTYSNHHPMIHTLIIQFFLGAGQSLFRNYSSGLALYAVVQMLFLSVTFAYAVRCIEEMNAPAWLRNAIFLFYALFPVHAFYSVTVWKDIPFGVFALLFTISLWRLTRLRNQQKIPFRHWFSCFVFGLCFCIFRSNGLYAFIVCIPFLVVTLRKHWKHAVPTVCAVLLSVGIYKGVITNVLHAKSPNLTESLSIPIQQVARVLSYGGDITDSQYRLLDQVADTKRIPDLYDGRLCDPVKWYINDEGKQQQIADHPMVYLKLWFEIGLQNPLTYLDAYIAQTQGYWNPNIYYPTYQQERYPADARLYSDSPLNDSLKHTVLFSLPDALRELPAIGILWSTAFYSGMLVILLGAALLRRRSILPFVPCFAVLLTVLISAPIFAEFRYIYALVTTMPLLAGIACYDASEGTAAPEGKAPADAAQADRPAEA